MKKILSLVALSTTLLTASSFAAIVKDASDVFKRWISIQQIIPDVSFESYNKSTDPIFVADFRAQYETQLQLLSRHKRFLNNLTGGCITDYGYQITWPLKETFFENIKMFNHLADSDIGELLKFLKKMDLFETPLTEKNTNGLVEEFNGVTQLLFSGNDEETKTILMFNLANRYMEWLFGNLFTHNGQRMMVSQEQHQMLRYLYAVIWQKLAGFGWKNWHANSLAHLNQEAAIGKTVIYIAGGSDIFQLIKSGVYNIINIDPQLPTQPTYYTNDWEYLLHGSLEDRIVFNDKDTKLIMVRRAFRKNGKQFQAQLSNRQVILLDESETEWDIFNADLKKIGNYTLKRRFCNQNDFVIKPNETILMSFNELYYICLPQTLGGWGIDISKLPPNFTMHIKQLRSPVTRETISNMRTAALLNTTDLGYIGLGSCIN